MITTLMIFLAATKRFCTLVNSRKILLYVFRKKWPWQTCSIHYKYKAPHEIFHIVCVILLLMIICVIRKIYNKRKQNGLFLTICGRSSYLLSHTCTLETKRARNTDTHEGKYSVKQQQQPTPAWLLGRRRIYNIKARRRLIFIIIHFKALEVKSVRS